ncbi:toprim domain-containing protein [Brucella intermedia]|uniref:toprim domain-containing protein n=1 Tax=Brucella intermedia TaxID=94625 RepID=UPI00224AA9CE|nr:toprim domain-containing protein [Brucella intermedia]
MSEEDSLPSSPPKAPDSAIPFTSDFMPKGLAKRGLKLDTLRRCGYFVHQERGNTRHVANYYDQSGEMALQKFRDPEKNFWFSSVKEHAPQPKACQLYLQNIWGEKYDRKVVITEGELDALTVAQETNFKIAVVSIPAGVGSALESLKANYRWLDRFEEIILWMDNDEPGQSVVNDCARLFEPGKVKTIKVPGVKDASELLQAGKGGDVYAAVYAATTWSPQGIVNAADCVNDVMNPEATVIAKYPFPILQDKTTGILSKEVVYHVAGTGIGKTSIIVEIQNALLEQNIKFGVIRFEDTRGKAQLDLISRAVKDRLHLRRRPPEEMATLHAKVFGDGLVELFDPETAEWTWEAMKGYIRYMVKALGCRVVFVDPLSFLVAGLNEKDERKALDHVAYELSRLVKQMDFNLQIAHHLNRGEGKAFEEGGEISLKNIRGSAGVANFSMSVFAYERNQQGERPDLTRIRILKNRWAGWTGIADTLKWDDMQGLQEPTDEPYPDSNNKGEATPAFGQVQEY